MRSSKSRSRSKTNRPRTLGNIINRVFDSSGPEGKVRGTPQQIIEKYLFLARDAQLSNDRVAAENFLQHAEHYTRLLGEANRELAAEQDSRQQYQPQGGQQNGGQNGQPNGNQNVGQNSQRDRDGQRQDNRGEGRPDPRNDSRPDARPDQRNDNRTENRNDPRPERERNEPRRDDRAPDRAEFRGDFRADPEARRDADPRPAPDDVIDLSGERDAGLVDLPETSGQRTSRSPVARKPVKADDKATGPVAVASAKAPAEPASAADTPGETPAEPAAKTRTTSTRRPRSTKKPADADATGTSGDTSGSVPREAAE